LAFRAALSDLASARVAILEGLEAAKAGAAALRASAHLRVILTGFAFGLFPRAALQVRQLLSAILPPR
jgi:hypothetical protein